jgi:hypothetical protein
LSIKQGVDAEKYWNALLNPMGALRREEQLNYQVRLIVKHVSSQQLLAGCRPTRMRQP